MTRIDAASMLPRWKSVRRIRRFKKYLGLNNPPATLVSDQAHEDYQLPVWFLNHCVQTAELSTRSPIVHWDGFDSLQSVLKAAMLTEDDGSLLEKCSTVLFSMPISGMDPKIIVRYLAAASKASLVEVDEYVISKLSLHLKAQEEERSPEPYMEMFLQPPDISSNRAGHPDISSHEKNETTAHHHVEGTKRGLTAVRGYADRSERVILSMLNAAKAQTRTRRLASEPKSTSPSYSSAITFMYYSATSRELDSSKSEAWLYYCCNKIAKFRASGEKVFLIISYPDIDNRPGVAGHLSLQAYFAKRAKKTPLFYQMDGHLSNIIAVEPSNQDIQRVFEYANASWVRDLNIRGLQQEISHRVPSRYQDDTLAPWNRWVFLGPEFDSVLETQVLGKHDLEYVARRIAGLTETSKGLLQTDLKEVLRQFKLRYISSTEVNTSSHIMFREVYPSLSREEADLMRLVVDPDKYTVSMKDFVTEAENLVLLQLLVSRPSIPPPESAANQLVLSTFKSALLYGPSGTGKTQLCHVLAKSSGRRIIEINSRSLQLDRKISGFEPVRKIFSLARKLHPCILIFDDAHMLFSPYQQDPNTMTWSDQCIQEMEMLQEHRDSPFVLFATKLPLMIHPDLLRHVPYKVWFDLPDLTERSRLFKLFLRDTPLHESAKANRLAHITPLYSGADIEIVCSLAKLIQRAQHLLQKTEQPSARKGMENTDSLGLLEEYHVRQALKQRPPSTSAFDQNTIRAFAIYHGQSSGILQHPQNEFNWIHENRFDEKAPPRRP